MRPEDLVGRRFVADFRVAAIGESETGKDEDRQVVLYMHGERFAISLGELTALVDSGMVVEAPERG